MSQKLEKEFSDKEEELIEKYKIDIQKLKQEQLKLASQLEIKDCMDFSNADSFAGIDSQMQGNKILVCVSVLDRNFNLISQSYSVGKMIFPYISGFRAYRELPAMIDAINKLDEKPDVIFVKGYGITHLRLGLASHLSLAVGIPAIGVSEKLIAGQVKKENIEIQGKIVGKVLQTKQGSNPLYVSPGNNISVETALKLTKNMVNYPHKLPEPLHIAGRYGKKMRSELITQ